MIDIAAAIPHRAPFLLLDEVVEIDADRIVATTTLRDDDELFSRVYAGHYPGSPITPGVLLCEMVFQAAAVLIRQRLKDEAHSGMPVLTRIGGAKFKQMVKPGDTVEITATFGEQLANAFYMKGGVKVDGKIAVEIDYTVALVQTEPGGPN